MFWLYQIRKILIEHRQLQMFLNISLCCIQIFFKLPQTRKRTNMAFVSEWMTNKANSCLGSLSQARHVSSTPILSSKTRTFTTQWVSSSQAEEHAAPHPATWWPQSGLRAGVLPAVAGDTRPPGGHQPGQPAAPVQSRLVTHSNLHVAFF